MCGCGRHETKKETKRRCAGSKPCLVVVDFFYSLLCKTAAGNAPLHLPPCPALDRVVGRGRREERGLAGRLVSLSCWFSVGCGYIRLLHLACLACYWYVVFCVSLPPQMTVSRWLAGRCRRRGVCGDGPSLPLPYVGHVCLDPSPAPTISAPSVVRAVMLTVCSSLLSIALHPTLGQAEGGPRSRDARAALKMSSAAKPLCPSSPFRPAVVVIGTPCPHHSLATRHSLLTCISAYTRPLTPLSPRFRITAP